MSKGANTDTYLFNIDKHGDISAHLEDYILGFEAYSGAICLDVDDEGMLPFYLHLDDEELLIRHPGAIRKLPIEKPVRPIATDPNFSNNLKLFDKDDEIYKSYRNGVLLLIDAFYAYLTDDLKQKIKRADARNGMASVTCNVIYKQLISQFGNFTDSARNNLKAIIMGPLNLSLSLESNLTNMLTSNSCLASHKVGYRDWELFDFAYEKLINNERTKHIALRYKTRIDFVHPSVSFSHFSNFMMSQYDIEKSTLPDSTAAAAFKGDPVKTPVTLPDTYDNVAAAVISPGRTITLTEKEYEDLKALASSSSPRKRNDVPPRPAPGYCILHGYGNHGPGLVSRHTSKPTFCKSMSDKDGNPKPGTVYTKEQILCKSSKGGPIAGMPRCQDIQAGYTKP